LFRRLQCLFTGHSKETPLVEAWATIAGVKRSYFLCRRCHRRI